MWDWIKALFDGGLTLFFFAAFIAAVLTWAHEHVRPYAPWWESVLVLAGWLVVLGIYPLWNILNPPDVWHRFVPGVEPSSFTYDKMMWVDLWGVIAGRIGFGAFVGWVERW